MSSITRITRMCALCHEAKGAQGGGFRFVRGLKSWVCLGCKPKTNH